MFVFLGYAVLVIPAVIAAKADHFIQDPPFEIGDFRTSGKTVIYRLIGTVYVLMSFMLPYLSCCFGSR